MIPNLKFQLQQFTVNHLVRITIEKLILRQTGEYELIVTFHSIRDAAPEAIGQPKRNYITP